MKVMKSGTSLVVVIPKEMQLKQGDNVDWVYSDEIDAYCLVLSKDWSYYVSLENVADKELYERYKEGLITCSGLFGHRIMKRIEGYVMRVKRKIIDEELKR